MKQSIIKLNDKKYDKWNLNKDIIVTDRMPLFEVEKAKKLSILFFALIQKKAYSIKKIMVLHLI